MSDQSAIQWTDATWNPVVGCRRVSPGCEHCYAETMAYRLERMGQERYRGLTVLRKGGRRWSGGIRLVPEVLDKPLRWRKPRMVFVNSMSDLFHEAVPFEYIAAVFGVMAACPQHTFQVLTKRPERMLEWFRWAADRYDGLHTIRRYFDADAYQRLESVWLERGLSEAPWPLPNVWIGVSCENQETADERVPLLLQCPAAVRWVSAEPLLGPIDFGKWLDPWTCSDCEFYGSQNDSGPCHCSDCDLETAYDTGVGGEKCPRCGKDDGSCDAVGDTCPQCGSVEGWSRDHGFMFDSERPSRLDWVVVGGESGRSARVCDISWVGGIVRDCDVAGVPVFVKQMGANSIGWEGRPRHPKGGDIQEWPENLRVRQWAEGVTSNG